MKCSKSICVLVLLYAALAVADEKAASPQQYAATWESLDQHTKSQDSMHRRLFPCENR